MAHILIMPRQGNTVESCVIQEWQVKEGDRVAADQAVCVVETDKAAFEVPAGAAGTVLKLLYASGDDVPVLEPIAVIGAAGEDWQAALPAPLAAAPQAPLGVAPLGAAAQSLTDAQAQTVAGVAPAASPRARKLAALEGLPLDGLAGSGPAASGPEGRIIERDVRAALEGRPALTAAALAGGGLAPGAASGSGLAGRVTVADLAAPAASPVEGGASGSGLAGRVTVADLAAPAASPVEGGASGLAGSGRAAGGTGRVTVADLAAGGNMAPAASGLAAGGLVTDTPIKGIRKLIAGRMYQSLAESAQFTLNGHAPAARMQALRARMKASDAELGLSKLSLNDLILYAVSRVLPRYPFMNAHKLGDIRDGSAVLRSFERVHLGMAVDTPRGLMVPVIRNADSLSLRQISAEAKRLAAAAQTGAINPDELSGSSFTVTNLGSLGVTAFTPILNLPEVAILGVCGIELRPVEQDGADQRFSLEPHIGFSLTINHQVVDGAPAARFLKTLGEAVADIDLWLAL